MVPVLVAHKIPVKVFEGVLEVFSMAILRTRVKDQVRNETLQCFSRTNKCS